MLNIQKFLLLIAVFAMVSCSYSGGLRPVKETANNGQTQDTKVWTQENDTVFVNDSSDIIGTNLARGSIEIGDYNDFFKVIPIPVAPEQQPIAEHAHEEEDAKHSLYAAVCRAEFDNNNNFVKWFWDFDRNKILETDADGVKAYTSLVAKCLSQEPVNP